MDAHGHSIVILAEGVMCAIERVAGARPESIPGAGGARPGPLFESWTRLTGSGTLQKSDDFAGEGPSEGGLPITHATNGDTGERTKTQGEIEAAATDAIAHFMQSCMGRGPKTIHAYLVADMLLVRLDNVLTVAESHLFASLEPEKGRDLFKNLRTQVVEASRERLSLAIEAAVGVACVSMHHDISTVTGEEVFVFRLEKSPAVRIARKR
jgi:uncharacterized protein YbcI